VGRFYSEVAVQKREAEGTVRTKHQLILDPNPEGTQKNLDDRRYGGREEHASRTLTEALKIYIVYWNSYAVFNDNRQLRIPLPLTKRQMMLANDVGYIYRLLEFVR